MPTLFLQATLNTDAHNDNSDDPVALQQKIADLEAEVADVKAF